MFSADKQAKTSDSLCASHSMQINKATTINLLRDTENGTRNTLCKMFRLHV